MVRGNWQKRVEMADARRKRANKKRHMRKTSEPTKSGCKISSFKWIKTTPHLWIVI